MSKKDQQAGQGHNRKAIVKHTIAELERIAEEKAKLSDEEKDLKGALKEKFPEYKARTVNRILAKRKLSKEVREEEADAEYQMELDLGMCGESQRKAA